MVHPKGIQTVIDIHIEYWSKVWDQTFFKSSYSAHQGCIYLDKNALKTVQLGNIIKVKKCNNSLLMLFFSYDLKLNFQHS